MRENISTSEDFLLVHERNGLDFGRVHLFRLDEGVVSQPHSLPFTSPPTECPALSEDLHENINRRLRISTRGGAALRRTGPDAIHPAA